MKQVLIVAVALVLGLVAGSIWPMSEVRALEKKVAELEARKCKTDNFGSRLAEMFRGRPLPSDDAVPRQGERRSRRDKPKKAETAESEVVETDEAEPEQEGEPAAAEEKSLDDPDLTREERLEIIRTGMEIRRKAARQSLEDDLGPTKQQMQTFDGVVADMNLQLKDIAQKAVDEFGDGQQEPTRRDMMVFAADTLDVLIDAQDKMEDSLDPEQVEAASDEALDPFQYIDPELIELLSQLDELRPRRDGGPRGWPPGSATPPSPDDG